jgi:hypothetical protein
MAPPPGIGRRFYQILEKYIAQGLEVILWRGVRGEVFGSAG